MTAADLVLAVAAVAFAVLSVMLAVIDARTHRLPNRIVLPAYPLGIATLVMACLLGAPWSRLGTALAGMLLLFAAYAVMRLSTRSGIGGGDVKLAGVIGLVLGWVGWDAVLVGVAATFILGGLFGAVLLASRRAEGRTRIAFGPWMLAGAWVGLVASWVPAVAASSVA